MTDPNFPDQHEQEGLPPFVKSWPQMYILIIGVLVLQIVLFYLFMTHYQ